MEVGASQLPTAKPSRGTLGHRPFPFRVTPTGLSPSAAGPSSPLRLPRRGGGRAPTTPHLPQVIPRGFGLGSPPFGRPYSGDPCWFLFLPLLRCFRSGGSHSVLPYSPEENKVSRAPWVISPWQEVPFGDPRFDGCLRLPGAYRSLPRPSSAPEPSHPPGGLRALDYQVLPRRCHCSCRRVGTT